MPSSKEPVNIVDAPKNVVEMANTDKRIVLNLRPDHWPKEWVEKIRNDRVWQITCQISDGFFIAPSLTDFMNTIKGGEALVILCQDAGGEIFMVKTNTRGVQWAASRQKAQSYGVLGQVMTEEGKGKFSWHIWASYVLAVARLSGKVKPSCTPDPTGEKFLKVVAATGEPVLDSELTTEHIYTEHSW